MSFQRPGAWNPHTSRPSGFGSKRVLELVAVAPLLECRDDRLQLEAVKLADPAQRVFDLGALDLELAFVGQHLPGGTGVISLRRDALGAGLDDLDRARLGVRALGLPDQRADAVAGHGARDEHDVTVEASNAGAAVRQRVDGQLELVTASRAGAGLGGVRGRGWVRGWVRGYRGHA